MPEYVITGAIALAPLIIAFVLTHILTKRWINAAQKLGLVGRDMNKPGEVKVAEAGGVWAVIGTAFGLLAYVALRTYFLRREVHLLEIYSLVTVMLLAAFIGFLDDILGWKKGLKAWQKVVFTASFALPLMVIKAGRTRMDIPFIGEVDLGLVYTLILVPIGVTGAANGFNMLAGYNGLEAGMGILLLSGLAVKSLMVKRLWIAYMSLIGIVSLLAFLRYNWCPAKVFPGNSLTYAFGAYYASLVILGNMEKYGIAIFAPYFLDALLYFRAKVIDRDPRQIEAFAKVLPDGSLEEPYEKIYDVTHLAIRVIKKIKGKVTEKDVVLFCYLLEILCILLFTIIL